MLGWHWDRLLCGCAYVSSGLLRCQRRLAALELYMYPVIQEAQLRYCCRSTNCVLYLLCALLGCASHQPSGEGNKMVRSCEGFGQRQPRVNCVAGRLLIGVWSVTFAHNIVSKQSMLCVYGVVWPTTELLTVNAGLLAGFPRQLAACCGLWLCLHVCVLLPTA